MKQILGHCYITLKMLIGSLPDLHNKQLTYRDFFYLLRRSIKGSEQMDAFRSMWHSSRRVLHLARYRFALDFAKNKDVLDIACGMGYGTYLLSKEANQVFGLDVSKDVVDYAMRNYSSKNVIFIVGNAQNFNIKQQFDLIVSFETIEHIPNPSDFLKNVSNHLKDDGIFIISTPNEWGTLTKYHLFDFSYDDIKQLTSKYFFVESEWIQNSGELWNPLNRGCLPGIYPLNEDNKQLGEILLFVLKKR